MARYIKVTETGSTNTYTARVAAMLPSGTVIYTYRQSAGRGQRGNSWESEPDKNVTFSLLVKNLPVVPSEQFCISEVASLAVYDFMSQYADGFSIKWPNDIYHYDRKVSGMLIEHSLCGNSIGHSIIGIGMNINQTVFVSDAPNPVSLAQITGKSDYDLDAALHDVCDRLEQGLKLLGTDREALHRRYLDALYRNDGMQYRFRLPSGELFMARIVDVQPDGMFVLKHADGSCHSYAFKEVVFVI